MEDPTYERAKAVRAEGAKGTERSFTLYCVSDSDLVSLKSGEINSISETEKGGADDLFAEVFEEKESLAKLTSIVEKARVAVGNESSTVPLVLNAIFLEEMSVPRSYSVMEACPNANILVLHPT